MTLVGSVPTGGQSAPTGGEFVPPRSVREQYVERIGRLSTGLHRLEFLLRTFLVGAEGPSQVVNINTVTAWATEFRRPPSLTMRRWISFIKRYNTHADARLAIPAMTSSLSEIRWPTHVSTQ